MPKTIGKRKNNRTIGGAFSTRKKADKAVAALRKWGVPEHDIQISQALSYNKTDQKAVRKGNIIVAVQHVLDPSAIIEIFDRYEAEFNPNGSRNVRQDVVGMTAGSAMGAAAMGAVGAVLGGPIGAATGAAAGAILGAGTGAAAGKAIEDRK